MKKPYEIFEAVKKRNDIGIGASMLTDEVLRKTGEQLIADEVVIQELHSYRDVDLIHHILYCILDEYGWGEWVMCLYLQLLPKYSIPMLSKVLSVDALVPGFYYKGEILWRILRDDGSVWAGHPEWKQYFAGLVKKVFVQYSENELKKVLDERIYSEWISLTQMPMDA